jgi:L-iditol 2-dehydrogenase
MSQYLTTKTSRIYKINPDLPWEEAAYLEPLATAVHGVRRLRVNPGEDCLVIGAGNLGLVNAQVARAFGANTMVSEIQEQRVKISQELGFPTVNPTTEDLVEACKKFAGDKMMDSVIMAVGATKANDQALSVIGFDGKVLYFAAGYPAPELHIDSNIIHYREYELIGTMSAAPTDFVLSAKYLSNGTVKTGKLISFRVPIDDVQKAFELAATPGNYRVALTMW